MDEVIELERNSNTLMNDAIDRIVVEFYKRKREQNQTTFLLTGSSSEVGTTSICFDVAIALAATGYKTVFVDCDLRKRPKYKKVNSKNMLGLVDYLSDVVKKESIISPTSKDNLSYISCGNNVTSPVRLLCSAKMENFVKELKDEFDFVIFDFPSIDIVPDAEILIPYVDGVCLVTALRKTTKHQLSEAKQKMESFGDKYIGLIINRVEMNQYRKFHRDFDYFKIKNMEDWFTRNLGRRKKKY